MPEKKKRLPKDFDIKDPVRTGGRQITDPDRADLEEAGQPVDTEYPKHLVAFEDGPGSARLVEVAQNAADERKLRAQGYGTHHELDVEDRKAAGKKAPKAAKPKAAKAPRNPKPKAPKGEGDKGPATA